MDKPWIKIECGDDDELEEEWNKKLQKLNSSFLKFVENVKNMNMKLEFADTFEIW